MFGLVRCVPVSVPFSDLLKSWGGGCVTGTQLVPMGHSKKCTHVFTWAHVTYIRACLRHRYTHSSWREHGLLSAVHENTCFSM